MGLALPAAGNPPTTKRSSPGWDFRGQGKEALIFPACQLSLLRLPMCARGHPRPSGSSQVRPDKNTQPTHSIMRSNASCSKPLHFVKISNAAKTDIAPLIKLCFTLVLPSGQSLRNYEVKGICLWRYQSPSADVEFFVGNHLICVCVPSTEQTVPGTQ